MGDCWADVTVQNRIAEVRSTQNVRTHTAMRLLSSGHCGTHPHIGTYRYICIDFDGYSYYPAEKVAIHIGEPSVVLFSEGSRTLFRVTVLLYRTYRYICIGFHG